VMALETADLVEELVIPSIQCAAVESIPGKCLHGEDWWRVHRARRPHEQRMPAPPLAVTDTPALDAR